MLAQVVLERPVLWSVEQLADVFAGWPGSTIDPFPLPGGWLSLPRYFAVILEYLFVPLALVSLWQRRRDLGSWIGFGAPMGAIWSLAVHLLQGPPLPRAVRRHLHRRGRRSRPRASSSETAGASSHAHRNEQLLGRRHRERRARRVA